MIISLSFLLGELATATSVVMASANPMPVVSTRMPLENRENIACGSRGGPGVRGANGRCLSWRDMGYGGSTYRGRTNYARPPSTYGGSIYSRSDNSFVPSAPTLGSNPSTVTAPTSRLQDKITIQGLVLEIRQGEPPELYLGERIVLKGFGATRLSFHGLYYHFSKSFVLVHESSGGNSCPGFFYVLEIAETKVIASSSFGTCSDLPEVTFTRDSLLVALPDARRGRIVCRYTPGKNHVEELR